MTLESPKNLEGNEAGMPKVSQEMLGSEVYDDIAREDLPELESEGKEGSWKKKKIEIPGFGEIEYTEKRVMFPEKIVQETGGVKGYVRKMVEWKSYNEALEKLLSIEEIKELGLLDMDISPSSYRHDNGDEGFKIRQQSISGMTEINSVESLQLVQNILDKWGRIFSGYYSDWNRNWEDEEGNKYKDKLLGKRWERLQKVIPDADMLLRNIIDALGNQFIERDYIHVMEGVWETPTTKNFRDEFRKKMILQEIFDPELADKTHKIREETLLFDVLRPNQPGDIERLPVTLRGLSVSNGSFWSCDGNKDHLLSSYCGRPFFGFSNKNAIFKKYLKSCCDLFRQKDEKSMFLETCGYSSYKIIRNERVNAFGSENKHPIIPVILGHPNIPKLRWCHAQHAYIPTKNGYNIIEMIT